MKKIISLLIILFIIITSIMSFCPQVTAWDRSLIFFLQGVLKNIPVIIPLLPDCILYSIMIAIPIIGFSIYFIKKRWWFDLILICSVPLVTFLLNCIIKPLVHRPRPPYELQLVIHPESFSYVSSHSLVTCSLYGMVIYYINKYCQNRNVKILITTISVIWILFVGFSRIWLGVHYPTDVLGAYVLGLALVFSFIKALELKK